jgi:hypothetical protein
MNKIDFSQLGFTDYQTQDLRIILGLKTKQHIQDWMESVGPADVLYGMSLVECAALSMLDQDVEAMTAYPEAMAVIRGVQGA